MMQAMSDFKKPNIKWGLLEIHPYYKFAETYDSNIYLVPRRTVPASAAAFSGRSSPRTTSASR
jgi:hypothetical protein